MKDPFLHHFQQNLESVNRRLSEKRFLSLSTAFKDRLAKSDTPGASTEWQFVNYTLQLLHLLSQALSTQGVDAETRAEAAARHASKPKRPQDAPPLPKTALSVAQLGTVRNALQFVTSLGICPNVTSGVGIPLQHRSKVLTPVSLDTATVADISECSESSKARLSVCVSVLREMLKVPALQSVILTVHLSDILSALLQLRHLSPLSEKSSFRQTDPQTGETMQDPANKSKSDSVTHPQQFQNFPNPESPPAVCRNNGEDSFCTAPEKTDCDTREVPVSGAEMTGAVDCGEVLECVLASASPVSLIRELMVLQAGVPKHIQSARNPGAKVIVPPGWLKKSCSRLLFRLTKGPQGIRHLYEAVSASSNPGSPLAWKHCGTVAKIVSGHPVNPQFLDQYVANISRQLTDLLHTEGKFTQLVGTVASAMTTKHKEMFHHHFHHPLLQSLLCCLEIPEKKVDGTVAVSEEDLTECLQNLHKVYIRGQQPLSDILCSLQPVLKVLWVLFCVTHSAVYNIRQWVKDLLVNYLKSLGHREAAGRLYHLSCGQGPHGVVLAVRFEAGSQGGLQGVYAGASRDSAVSDSQKVGAVIAVLQDLKTDGVAGELLVTLLKEMTEMISKETQPSDIMLPASTLSSEVREEKKGEIMRRVTLLHLLASICETFGSACLCDNTHILLFVKASLERGVAVCQVTDNEETAIFETESMSMALGLLTAVMAGAVEMKDEDRKLMDTMQPLLEVIGQGHSDEFIREMASDIRIAIATRGAVWSSLHKNKKGENGSKNKGPENSGPPQRSKTSATDANKRGDPHPFMEVSVGEQHARPTQTPLPSRPLIEVLSDHPFVESETRTEKRTCSAKARAGRALTEETTSKDRQPSGVSLIKDDTSAASLQTNASSSSSSSSSQTESTGTAGLNSLSPSVFREVPASRTDKESDPPVTSVPEDTASESSPSEEDNSPASERSEESPLQTVFKELCDPLLPVRGHALVTLARLVQERDPQTLTQKAVVQEVFEENLGHGDSYLYLAAISGLSALSNRFPESVIPSLAKEFAGLGKSESRLTAEHRLKVGEALMKATKNLGEMIPKYRELLLGAVLSGAQDRDATVRASSISNLAEVCSLLRFSLGPVLHEVLHCCGSVLETDEAIVRQAAALTLARLLEGLGRDCFTVLESVLPNLYRLLKKVCATDKDEKVRLHASIALDHLDRVTRNFAFPRQTLQKKIQVLPDASTFR